MSSNDRISVGGDGSTIFVNGIPHVTTNRAAKQVLVQESNEGFPNIKKVMNYISAYYKAYNKKE